MTDTNHEVAQEDASKTVVDQGTTDDAGQTEGQNGSEQQPAPEGD